MDVVNLIGVDPGIVDTGVVWVRLDRKHEIFKADARVWRNVTKKIKGGIEVSEQFLDELDRYVAIAVDSGDETYVFIEGYRNRGRNPGQDQKMSHLVQVIHKLIKGSVVVDNTGVKNVVTDETLRLLRMYDWKVATNHADLRSAARILMKGAYQEGKLNVMIADVIRGRLVDQSWTLTNSLES